MHSFVHVKSKKMILLAGFRFKIYELIRVSTRDFVGSLILSKMITKLK